MVANEARRPARRIAVLTDNDSWVLPYSQRIVDQARNCGDDAILVRDQRDLPNGDVAFFLGCVNIVKPAALARHQRNLVVHASDLPKGRGFSPWTWLVLEGRDRIPVCLIDAADEVDAGAIVYKEDIQLSGKELVEDLRDAIGRKTVELCLRFLSESVFPAGRPQTGSATTYPRRTPRDSGLDIDASIRSQFNLLRTVDNDRYPAFFHINGAKYLLKIERVDKGQD